MKIDNKPTYFKKVCVVIPAKNYNKIIEKLPKSRRLSEFNRLGLEMLFFNAENEREKYEYSLNIVNDASIQVIRDIALQGADFVYKINGSELVLETKNMKAPACLENRLKELIF